MITRLDHVALAVSDLNTGAQAYETLLGRAPFWRASRDGVATAIFDVGNTRLELMAPDGLGGERLAEVIATEGEGLKSLAFAVDDIERAHRRLARVGLEPVPITAGESVNVDGARRVWRRTRADSERTYGARLFFLQIDAEAPAPPVESEVIGLDHAVLRTGDIDRAAALYGARLGLDLRLDLDAPALGARFLFFRVADVILEVLRLGDDVGGDRLWGLSWRVRDAEAARARLAAAGVEASPVLPGRKPGTRVFTVRSGTCGTPTLMVGPG